MLSTITPFAERGRGNAYRTTTSWFVVGATVGGMTTGAVAAGLAAVVGAFHPPVATVGTVGVTVAVVAFLSDSGALGVRVPIHRRQVNERWLDHYRAWVYGAGFGWQIGTGLATYITSAAVYLMVALAALTGTPWIAFGVATVFGLVRGLAVLLTRHLTGPADLLAFHRRFMDRGPRVGHLVVATEAAAAIVLTAVVRTPAAWSVLAVALVGAASGLLLGRPRRLAGDPVPSDIPGASVPSPAATVAVGAPGPS